MQDYAEGTSTCSISFTANKLVEGTILCKK